MLYILLILLVMLMFMVFFEEYISERDRKRLFYSTAAVMAVVAGFRPDDVDKDYNNYVYLYNSFDITTEISFILISELVRATIDNVGTIFVVYAFLTITLITAAIKKLSPWILSSLLIYFSQNYMLHCMTQMRVSVASAIFLLALPTLFRGERWKYTLMVFCAMMFHYSAIAYLLFLFINGKEISGIWKFFWIGIIPVCMVLSVLKIDFIVMLPIPYIEEKIKVYDMLMMQGEGAEINSFNAVFLVRVIMAIFIIWKIRLLRTLNKYVDLLLKIEIAGLCALQLFTSLPVVSFRISEMICVVEIILYPMFAITIIPQWLGKVVIILIAAAFFYLTIFYNKIFYIV